MARSSRLASAASGSETEVAHRPGYEVAAERILEYVARQRC
ncbi:hypothetical protein ABZ554_11990 [Streptomyces sp. NPDC020125]